MNLLTEQLPAAVEINGREYALDTDFRAALRVIMAFEDTALTAREKQAVLLENLYPERPDDLQEALRLGVKFLNGSQEPEGETGEPGPRLYSFSKDSNFIFSAFRQTHGIDLATADLHWWVFVALFMDLGQDTFFCKLVGLRKKVLSGKASKEERLAANEMGDLFDIEQPDTRTDEEKARAAEFERLLAEGAKNRAQ